MTKYQIIAVTSEGRFKVGDPHELMSLAEIHAEELRDLFKEFPEVGSFSVAPIEVSE